MHVAFNTSPTRITGAGIHTYITQLTAALRREFPDTTFSDHAYEPRFSRSRRFLRTADTLLREVYWTQYALPRHARTSQADVLHVMDEHAPFHPPVPLVLTIHDLHPLHHPGDMPTWHRFSSQFYLRHAIPAARNIITDSLFVKNDLLQTFPGLDPNRITPIHIGVADHFRPASDSACQEARARYQLTRPYILAVSTLAPNKNLPRLVEAFVSLHQDVPHDLVVVGAHGWRHAPMAEIARRHGVQDRIRYLGYVPTADLPPLFTGAAVFAFPSLYEGFGLPPLEAMACGTLVLASTATSLPEVLGNSALLVDPYSTQAIGNGLRELLALAPTARAERQAAGRAHAAQFTWARCARQTMNVYHQVAP